MNEPSQDDDQALVAPFQALNGHMHQRRALKCLVGILTHHQIRDLRSVIDEVDLHCDIIAQLPLDVSHMILQYLPSHQIFQARRVSSKWRQILSPARTVETLLRDWYPKGQVDESLQIPADLPADSVASFKAEYIDAYRTGHAFSYARYERALFTKIVDFNRVAYADGRIAFVNKPDFDSIRTINLKTGQEWSFTPEARTKINAIAMSSSMVAALGSGRCHIWTFRTEDSHYLRLPSDRRAAVAVSGETLAIVYCHEWYSTDPRNEVVTWTLKDQRTDSFVVALSHGEPKIMLDSTGETLLLFKRVPAPHPVPPEFDSMHFHYIRTSLDGVIIAQGFIEIANLQNYDDCSNGTLAKEVNANTVIWSYYKHQPEKKDFFELMLICYNFREDRLEVREHMITGQIRGLRINSFPATSNLIFWRDVVYFLELDYSGRRLRVINLQNLTCSEAKMGFPINSQGCYEPYLRGEERSMLLGDEKFLISVFCQEFGVWCFDPNVQMVNEDTAYKEQRKTNMERRLLLKQGKKDLESDRLLARKLD